MPENRHHPVRRPKRGKRVKKRKAGLTPLLVAGLIVVGAVAMGEPEPAKGAQKEPAEAIQVSGVDVQSVITMSEIVREGEDPLEDEKIEAALMEQGYFLEEVPLGFTEQDFLHTACQEAGIPYALALAVIEQETDFRNVMGDDGASCGYMQVQEKWHRERMERLGVTDLMDPFGNFRVGCDFLAELMGKYPTQEALTAYNSGSPGYNQYSYEVMDNYEKWKELVGDDVSGIKG